MMGRNASRFAGWAVLLLGMQAAYAQSAPDAAEIARARARFIDRLVENHGFERSSVEPLLNAAVIDESILAAISRPAERVVPWYEYRGIFMTDARINGGAAFWRRNASAIDAVSRRFGVAPEAIVAIVGVETLYGERMGRYRVIDALSTLAFAYPPRSEFFARELEAFFLLNREEQFALNDALGSYAGAMGAGQFIPSSFRAYAVDGDGDGHRDLWGNWQDILASVANYLSVHGWQEGAPVVEQATRRAGFSGSEPSNKLALDSTVAAIRSAGYEFDATVPDATAAAVYSVERDATGSEYWVAYKNFDVITRYNRSVKYALAVHQLGQAIKQAYLSSTGETG
jgi:membrane-bound lytic murein transglycosylase B